MAQDQNSHHNHVENLKVERDDERWETVITAEIPATELANFRTIAVKEIASEAKIDGFRPGHAPESAIVRKFGEQVILEHAAEIAIKHILPEILAAEKQNIVDAPKVQMATPLLGVPLSFTARAPLAPEIKLGDYKKIAAKKNAETIEVSVTDEEHKATLNHLRRERARIDAIDTGKLPEEAAEHARALEESALPALDDEFVKSLGYEGVEQFTGKVRENIKTEKEMKEGEKRRAKMLEEIVTSSTIKYPAILKDYELDDMEARMAGDLERMGSNMDTYLSHIKKNKEELRKEWLGAAEERAKVRLVLSEISRQEKIEPDSAKVEEEVARMKKQYADSDTGAIRAHVSHAMRNEAVMAWLESQK